MSRSERLLQLLEALRRRRRPVAGAALAEEMGVSLRSIYRDIATLQAQGANIEGEAGLGYQLKPGFVLPPLMFTEEEIEALVLGSRWVAERGDAALSAAGRGALAKILSVLPDSLREQAELNPLLVGPGELAEAGEEHLPRIRAAIRRERKLVLAYLDRDGSQTERAVWPFALGYFDSTRVIAAWCELRQGYRHFRTDRIRSLEVTEDRYPRRRGQLLAEWRRVHGFDPQ